MAEKMQKTVGIYLCSGCGIGDALDMEALEKMVGSEFKPKVCRTSEALCSPEAWASVEKDMADEEVNTVVVCACSMRDKTEVFSVDLDKIIERVSLREMVAWTHKPKDEDTQMLAEDYIRMGVSRAKDSEPPVPWFEEEEDAQEIDKTILVVGGGPTGMATAREVSKAGYKAVLVEKEAQLGGFLAKMLKTTPGAPPYTDLQETGLDALIKEVEGDGNITVMTSTTMEKISGAPGMFDAVFKNGAGNKEMRVGSIVQASGWVPYNASKLGHLGYGKSPDVITNVQLEEMAKAGAIKRPSDGKAAESIAFIQCAGSRDPEHLPYCSGVCCQVSLKQAKYLRDSNKDATAYIIYKDMRTPAQMERFYQAAQEDPGILLTKGEIKSVEVDSDKSMLVEVGETILGEDVRIRADLVVLATGMVPTTFVPEVEEGAEAAEGEEAAEATTDDGKKAAASAEAGAQILNLTYRKGTDLPTLKYGFPDSHYICFPYETQRTGIYAAGTVRAPMNLANCRADAAGAALKAIQCVELTERGNAVHPRSYDNAYPQFFLQRCTQCKRCTEECPFGTLDEDEKGTPKPNPTRCRRCGVCMGACPERIISFKNYSVAMIGNMIKSVEIPDEEDEKPRIIGLVCENDAYPALDISAIHKHQHSEWIRFIPIRCLGSVNTVWVADAMGKGVDGILLLGCKYGDDYQCHFIKGSELCQTRMDNISETLDKLALESDRIKLVQVALSEYHKVPSIINDFVEEVLELDPNPYKGF